MPKTDFNIWYEYYEFAVMPFELTNSLTAFMNLMHPVFKSYLDQFVVVFIDKILIYSKTKEEHERHLRMVLQTLREHQLFIKFSKWEYWLEKVLFLNHIISKDGLTIDSTKVETMAKWKQPENSNEICNFLDLSGYYCRFIKIFSRITGPLTDLTKKQGKFIWDTKCETSFQEVKSD